MDAGNPALLISTWHNCVMSRGQCFTICIQSVTVLCSLLDLQPSTTYPGVMLKEVWLEALVVLSLGRTHDLMEMGRGMRRK